MDVVIGIERGELSSGNKEQINKIKHAMQVHAKTCVQTRELSSRFVGRAAQCWPSATSPAMPANSRHLLPLLLLLSCRRLFTARSGAALLYVLSMSCGVWLCINLILEAARSVLASRNRSVFCRCFTISIVIQNFEKIFFWIFKTFFSVKYTFVLFCFFHCKLKFFRSFNTSKCYFVDAS